MNVAAIGPVLAVWRENLNVDQTTLATRLGCAQSWISRLEAGKGMLTVPFLVRWCEALGVELQIKIGPKKRGRR